MAIKKFKAMTNGTRHMSMIVNPELSKNGPEKSLTAPLKSSYGRDNYGHRTGCCTGDSVCTCHCRFTDRDSVSLCYRRLLSSRL